MKRMISALAVVTALGLAAIQPANASKKNTRKNEKDAKAWCADYKKKTGTSCMVKKCLPRIGWRIIKKVKRKFSTGYCVYISKKAKKNQNKARAEQACSNYKKVNKKSCWVHKGNCPVKRMPIAKYGKFPDKYSACREKKGAERLKKGVKRISDAAGRMKPKSKKQYAYWNLNIKYYIALKDCKKIRSFKCQKIIRNLRSALKITEKLFSRKPALKIKASFVYVARKGGKNLENLYFKNTREQNRFMDKYFDNVAKSRTRGHMTVLLVKSFKRKDKNWGGNAYFPLWVNPFNRKRGIIEVYYPYDGKDKNGNPRNCAIKSRPVIAHEIGHTLSLKHTFERGALHCAKGYKKGKKNMGKTARKRNGVWEINAMDYKDIRNGCPMRYYLNKCQAKRAAFQRRVYMTRGGKTNYRRLKGLR